MTVTTTDGDLPARDGKGRFVAGVDSIERDAEAMRLRSRGWSLAAISDELGYGDTSNVRRALAKHTERVTGEAAAELRQAQLEELDRLTSAATAVLEAKHVTISNGRVVTLPGPDGAGSVPVEDDAPVLRAAETLLRIQERRSKLLGLDAPTRQDINQSAVVRYTVEGVAMERLT